MKNNFFSRLVYDKNGRIIFTNSQRLDKGDGLQKIANKKKVSFWKISLALFAVLLIVLVVDVWESGGIFPQLNNFGGQYNLSDVGIKNGSLLVHSDKGSRIYYEGNGVYTASLFPLVSADFSNPDTNITYSVYPSFGGHVQFFFGSYTLQQGIDLSIGKLPGFVGQRRGFIDFDVSHIPQDSVITNMSLHFNVVSAYGAGDQIALKKIDKEVNSSYNGLVLFNNISQSGIDRCYVEGLPTNCWSSVDVSSTGWKVIYLSNYSRYDLETNLGKNWSFPIGIYGSDESTDTLGIDFDTYDKTFPYLNITFYTNYSQKNITSYYDGYSSNVGIVSASNQIIVGDDHGTSYVGFINFNTSSIPENANISGVLLELNISNSTSAPAVNLSIRRLNGKELNSGLSASAIYGNVTSAQENYTSIQGILAESFRGIDLTTLAASDLQTQLSSDYFSIGFQLETFTTNELIDLAAGESATPPNLFITYTVPAAAGCSYGGSGDWTISTYCSVDGTEYLIVGDIIIQNGGLLNLTGSSNLTFSGANRYVYVYSGGEINLYEKSSFGL